MAKGRRRGAKANAEAPPSPSRIRYASAALLDGQLSIRFELLQPQPVGHQKGAKCSPAFYEALLSKFREICGRPLAVVFDNNKHEHPVSPEDMQDAGPIVDRVGSLLDLDAPESQFAEAYPWQLSLSDDPRTPWRIQGYLLGAAYYVVWLDPEHKFSGAGNRRELAGN
jgi:hypothetical protein